VLDRAMRRIPPDWIDNEEERARSVFWSRSSAGKKRIGELLEQSLPAFPNWKT